MNWPIAAIISILYIFYTLLLMAAFFIGRYYGRKLRTKNTEQVKNELQVPKQYNDYISKFNQELANLYAYDGTEQEPIKYDPGK